MRCCSYFILLFIYLSVLFFSFNPSLLRIQQSGNTLLPAFSIDVNKDGSGSMKNANGADIQDFSANTFSIKAIQQDMVYIPDPSLIPTGHCLKSISFGTTTKVSYANKESGDLQCVTNKATGVQKDFIKQIANIEKQALAKARPVANV